MMRTLWQDPRYGARILAPRPCVALIAGITIVLYIGAVAYLFGVNGVGLSRALFVSTNQAAEKLKASHSQFVSIKDRAVAAFPKEGERVRIAHNGVRLQALNITHGRNRPIENLGFIIEVEGWKLLHIGDSEATADDFRLNGLKREAIDVAFLPFWYFLNDSGRKAVRDEIQPRHIVLMHIPPPDVNDEYINRRGGWVKALGEIKADFPNAVWFEREMEQKEFR